MSWEGDLASTSQERLLHVTMDTCTKEVVISNSTGVAQSMLKHQRSVSHSSALTHTLKWANEKQALSIENASPPPATPSRLSHSEGSKDNFLNERKLRCFFSKVTKAAGRGVIGSFSEVPRHTSNEINQWIAEGYSTLQILHDKIKEQPWRQIASVGHPALMEQLIALQKLLEKPPFISAPYQAEFILKQALILAHQATAIFSPDELVHRSLEISFCELGKLIFAADRSPVTLIERVKLFQGNSLIEWLSDNVQNVIDQSKLKIKQNCQKHLFSGLQSPDLARRNKLIKETSDLLLLQDGTINTGLIHIVSEELVNSDMELQLKMNLLQSTPKLRSIVNSLNPTTLHQPILNTLNDRGLHENSTSQKRSAAFTALTALFSHLRQGNEGSCFATFLAINMLASRPVECAEDFIELLQKGYLTKYCDGISIQFPFIPSSYSESIDKNVLVTHTGQGLLPDGNKPYLWDSPGLQSAAYAMGIKDVKSAIEAYLQQLSAKTTVELPLTVKPLDIIRSFSVSPEIQYKGIKAFEEEETSPLLMAWVSSIAGMAEANESGILKSTVIVTILTVLIENIHKITPPFPKPLIELFNVYLNDELNKSLRFLYDRSIDNASIGNDQHSKKGGFVLFDRNDSISPDKWTKIDSSELFNALIQKHALLVLAKIKEQGNMRVIQWLELFTVTVQTLFESEYFLNETIKNINVRNNRLKNPLKKVDDLKYTPWLIRGGNNPKKILQVYLESSQLPTTEKFTPLSAPNLLQKILQLGQACSEHNHDHSKTNPYLLTPVRTQGLHSFSLMLGHPSLLKGFEKGADTNAWLQDCVLKPGKTIAASPIDAQMKRALIDLTLKKIVSSKNTQAFLDQYITIPHNVTIKEFRYHIKGILQRIQPNTSRILSMWMRKIDTHIYTSLQPNMKLGLENSAVHFADTNWYEGAHDVHFCFVVNPGNGKLEIWEAMDNGKNLSAADQMVWLQDHEWEIYEPFFLDKETSHVKK
ncbi:MAG: hypothetical protein WC222_07535 [Parachlamydiales bacterium]|jgi:hypothetical protein